MNNFKNKKILITGASSGIGEAFAKTLDSFGANLILTARSEDKLNVMAKKMNNAVVIAGDLSDQNFPKKLYNKVKEKNLCVDILINNAGFGFSGLFLDSSIDNYKDMLNVNVYSLMELSHLFLKDMVEQKSGGIINISSLDLNESMKESINEIALAVEETGGFDLDSWINQDFSISLDNYVKLSVESQIANFGNSLRLGL